MTDDSELLRRYAELKDELSFSELVQRHVDLVYTSALRQLGGNHHQAQEVTQMVFTQLARKASALIRHPVLAAWLMRSCHLSSLETRRKAGRRRAYEGSAAREFEARRPDNEPLPWERVGPVLDNALDELSEGDRRAIVLRYFSERPFAEIGRSLRLSENAARMRVDRAVEKLRERLARRGITSSSAALAAALTAQSVSAAPAGVAAASASAAVAVGAAVGPWVSLMAISKLPSILTVAAVIAGSTVLGIQQSAAARGQRDLEALRQANGDIAAALRQKARLAGEVLHASNIEGDAASVPALEREVKDLESAATHDLTSQNGAANGSVHSPTTAPGSYDLSQLDQRPKLIKITKPLAPASLPGGESGRVLVDFTIGPDGAVQNATAAESSDKAFEQSAIEAVSNWTFSPGQVAGQNVFVHMQVPIVYTPSQEPAPPTAATWF